MDPVEEPITDYAQLDPDKLYTYADYLKWKFQERVELIRGKILRMSPAPGSRHQAISSNFHGKIWTYLRDNPCRVFSAPFDVRLPVPKGKKPYTVVQPDLCVIGDPKKIDELGCNGAPDLVIEILSPGNTSREMQLKYEVYEEAGVREYWIVDPEHEAVMPFVLNESGKYIGLQPRTGGQVMSPAIFPDMEIDLADIFRE